MVLCSEEWLEEREIDGTSLGLTSHRHRVEAKAGDEFQGDVASTQGVPEGSKSGHNLSIWDRVVGCCGRISQFQVLRRDPYNIHHNPETWSMSQKDETQNIRGFPTRIYDFLRNLVSVFFKNDTAYPMETRSFLGKTCQRWRTQSAAWRAIWISPKKARFCFGPGRSNGLWWITPPSLEEWGWINSIHPNSSWRAIFFASDSGLVQPHSAAVFSKQHQNACHSTVIGMKNRSLTKTSRIQNRLTCFFPGQVRSLAPTFQNYLIQDKGSFCNVSFIVELYHWNPKACKFHSRESLRWTCYSIFFWPMDPKPSKHVDHVLFFVVRVLDDLQMAQPTRPEQVELPISNVAILKTFGQGSLMERNGPSMMMGKPSSGVKIVWKSLESQCLALNQFLACFLRGEGLSSPFVPITAFRKS